MSRRNRSRNVLPEDDDDYIYDDTWAQTLLTITPEDDAVLREIKPLVSVSAHASDLLDLHTDSFAYRRPLTPKYLVDPRDLEDENIRHTETQTYLQGIPVVDIPVRYKDQVSQTLYMSTPCPPVKYYKDIMTSMRDGPIPEIRNTRQTQTILSFDPHVTHLIVTEQLKTDIWNEEDIKNVRFQWTEEEYLQTELDAMIMDFLNYVQGRAFWILDPSSFSYPSTNENYTQTSIRYNQLTDSIVVDNETQTGLTCEPKSSNTELLVHYQTSKNLVKDILEECIDKAIESRLLVDDIIDEIINKCVERVRYPPKDQDIQTLASYKVHEDREDVLRKLQLPIVVDPLEASIVVIPLIDDLLKSVCEIVFQDARRVTVDILQTVVERSLYIGSKIDEIYKQSQGKPIEQILEQRRKKIAKLMKKKKTETVSTQTSISGIHEISKLEARKESYSCFCLKNSRCRVCLSTKTDKSFDREMKTMRTQDILLAYKPCRVVSSPLKMKIDRVSSKSIEERSVRPRISISGDSSSDSTATIEVVLKPKERVKLKDSLEGWSRAIDAALTIPWSPQSSLSNTDRVRRCSRSNNGVTLQTMKVLQILKSTFCTRGTCPMSVIEKLGKRSYEEVDLRTDSIHDTSLYSTSNNICISEKNLEDNGSTVNTETYDTLFENAECLCHVSYTVDGWHQPRDKNDSCKVKIIPVKFMSTT